MVSDAAAGGRRRLHGHAARAARLLDSGRKVALIDVREPVEWDINRIAGAELIPKSAHRVRRGTGRAAARPAPRCCTARPAVRSAEALAAVKKAGFADALTCRAASSAWAKQLEPAW